LQTHPIYSEGRKFAVYRWGITSKSFNAMEMEACKTKEASQSGVSAPKVSILSVEKNDCNQPTKLSCQQKKFH
jgi:hypothetical protein